jgi:hypothetical protein
VEHCDRMKRVRRQVSEELWEAWKSHTPQKRREVEKGCTNSEKFTSESALYCDPRPVSDIWMELHLATYHLQWSLEGKLVNILKHEL